ncbi:DUF3592 domain-containing protein [Streptomyces sp. NPDC002730]|uniref:DUF3592 domain-containing protein n=1 Tax=Streptomyces sp. NPDC002730 TaxID=3364662 RepID=UPI00367F7819
MMLRTGAMVAGLISLGLGVREIWTMVWKRNSGIRAVALVTRVVERDTGDGKWRAPVVAFTDDRDTNGEYEIRTDHNNPPRPGATVNVIYRPGRPASVRLDTPQRSLAAAFGIIVAFALGMTFLALGAFVV